MIRSQLFERTAGHHGNRARLPFPSRTLPHGEVRKVRGEADCTGAAHAPPRRHTACEATCRAAMSRRNLRSAGTGACRSHRRPAHVRAGRKFAAAMETAYRRRGCTGSANAPKRPCRKPCACWRGRLYRRAAAAARASDFDQWEADGWTKIGTTLDEAGARSRDQQSYAEACASYCRPRYRSWH